MYTAQSFTQNRTASLIAFIFVLFANVAFAQAEKNFVRSFDGHNVQFLTLDLGKHVDVQTWEGTTIRIVTNVRFTQENVSWEIIKGCAELGRYTLESDFLAQTLRITATNINHRLKLNGTPVKDHIRYTVFVPKNVEVIKSREELYSFAKP